MTTPDITIALINEIRDDAELTAAARIIVEAQKESRWQGFGSEWDQARFAAYMLRDAGILPDPVEHHPHNLD